MLKENNQYFGKLYRLINNLRHRQQKWTPNETSQSSCLVRLLPQQDFQRALVFVQRPPQSTFTELIELFHGTDILRLLLTRRIRGRYKFQQRFRQVHLWGLFQRDRNKRRHLGPRERHSSSGKWEHCRRTKTKAEHFLVVLSASSRQMYCQKVTHAHSKTVPALAGVIVT